MPLTREDLRVTGVVPEGVVGEFSVVERTSGSWSPRPPYQYMTLLQEPGTEWDELMDDSLETIAYLQPVLDFINYVHPSTFLLGGMGLGCLPKALLSLESVTRVDVVEINNEVIELVEPSIADPRLHTYHCDIRSLGGSGLEDPESRWDLAWFDLSQPDLSQSPLHSAAESNFRHRVAAYGSYGRAKHKNGDPIIERVS